MIDSTGQSVAPIKQFLRDFVAQGNRPASVRSYAYDLLRWWRWLQVVEVGWDKVTSAEVRDRETHPAPDATAPERGCIQVGLVATPALSTETVTRLANEVAALLSGRYPDVCWEVPSVRDPMYA